MGGDTLSGAQSAGADPREPRNGLGSGLRLRRRLPARRRRAGIPHLAAINSHGKLPQSRETDSPGIQLSGKFPGKSPGVFPGKCISREIPRGISRKIQQPGNPPGNSGTASGFRCFLPFCSRPESIVILSIVCDIPAGGIILRIGYLPGRYEVIQSNRIPRGAH